MGSIPPNEIVKLFLEHRDGLFGFILALTHDRAASEEIFQEVGLAIVEEASRGAEVTRFLPWVHEVARRRVADHYRKKSRHRLESLDDVVVQAFEEHAPDAGTRALRQDTLVECLEELPSTQRQMVEKRYRDHASIQQIARSLSWTEGAVKVALWKARRRLEGCIEGKVDGNSGEGL